MITVAVLTVSDSTVAGTRVDRSGPALAEHCQSLGWIIRDQAAVPDELGTIADQLRRWVSTGQVQCILTTGGTGAALRDITPEATRQVIDRELPGIAELMRSKGLAQTPTAVLSRGLAGTCARTVIINLPGSPSGALFSLQAVEHLIPHVIQLLCGDTEHN